MADPTPTPSERLAAGLAEWTPATLPQAVRDHARTLLLDTLLVAWAGAAASGMAGVRDWIAGEGGRAEAQVWAFGDRLPAGAAAFLNALSSSALDYDSLNRSVHPEAVTVAATLAVAERQHASGAEFLVAFVAASELVCRLSRAATGESRGWSHTPAFGVFGAALGAARLLQLDADATAQALGVALSMAGGTQQANVEQVLTKRLQPALAARHGVDAALAAQAGITGPRQAFDGRFGLWNMVQPCDADLLLRGFGTEFVLLETGLKQYPVCACSHAAMESVLALVESLGLQAGDIDDIQVLISPFMHRLVGTPFDPGDNLEVTAQFSIQYAIACMVLHRRLGIEELQPRQVLDPRIRQLTDRVRVTIDAANTGSLAPATVHLRARDGRRGTHTTRAMPGSAAAPMSDAAIESKLRACARAGLRTLQDPEVEALRDAVLHLEAHDDVAALTRWMRA